MLQKTSIARSFKSALFIAKEYSIAITTSQESPLKNPKTSLARSFKSAVFIAKESSIAITTP
jgi:hypothetical protein